MKVLSGIIIAVSLPVMGFAQDTCSTEIAEKTASVNQEYKAQERVVDSQIETLNKAYDAEKNRLTQLQSVLEQERMTEQKWLEEQCKFDNDMNQRRQAYETERNRINEQMKKNDQDWYNQRNRIAADKTNAENAYDQKMDELSKRRSSLEGQPMCVPVVDTTNRAATTQTVTTTQTVRTTNDVYVPAEPEPVRTGSYAGPYGCYSGDSNMYVRDAIKMRQERRKY